MTGFVANVNKFGSWKNSSRSYAYRSWQAMRSRCYRENDRCFHLYGARGIKVCGKWINNYDAFFEDMGDRDRSLSLDRIDSNGDYTPDNCRWVDMKTQQRNRRNNRIITYNNESLTISEWAERTGLRPSIILQRLNRDVPLDDLFRIESLGSPKHGTNNMYSKYKCRCPECKKFNTEKSQKGRDRLKLKKLGVKNEQ